jgi:hypothetical protein
VLEEKGVVQDLIVRISAEDQPGEPLIPARELFDLLADPVADPTAAVKQLLRRANQIREG